MNESTFRERFGRGSDGESDRRDPVPQFFAPLCDHIAIQSDIPAEARRRFLRKVSLADFRINDKQARALLEELPRQPTSIAREIRGPANREPRGTYRMTSLPPSWP